MQKYNRHRTQDERKRKRDHRDRNEIVRSALLDKLTLWLPWRYIHHSSVLRWILITICFTLSAYLLHTITTTPSTNHEQATMRVLQPTSFTTSQKRKHDPEKWLRDHSDMNHHETGQELFNNRPKAAIISLVRNEELDGILQSMRQLEWHWNRRYNYPWMFFSEQPFTDEFKVLPSLLVLIVPLTNYTGLDHKRNRRLNVLPPHPKISLGTPFPHLHATLPCLPLLPRHPRRRKRLPPLLPRHVPLEQRLLLRPPRPRLVHPLLARRARRALLLLHPLRSLPLPARQRPRLRLQHEHPGRRAEFRVPVEAHARVHGAAT